MTTPTSGSTLGRRLAIVASVVVLATIVASVLVNGSPAAQREAKLDARRVSDLGDLEDSIQRHVHEEGSLPASLSVLANKPGVRLAIVDPVSGQPYEFEPSGPLLYRLCATFTTDTAATGSPTGYGSSESDWAHGSGHRCFERTAKAKGS